MEWRYIKIASRTTANPKTTSNLTGIITADKHNTLKRKHKLANLSGSSPSAQSLKQQSRTGSFGPPLSNTATASGSGYGGSRGEKEKSKMKGVWVGENHKTAQDEREEMAVMVNVRKCMCG